MRCTYGYPSSRLPTNGEVVDRCTDFRKVVYLKFGTSGYFTSLSQQWGNNGRWFLKHTNPCVSYLLCIIEVWTLR